MQIGQYEKAIADFTALIDLNPDEKRIYGERAKAYRKLGQTALAEKDEKEMARIK
jgi:Flp pilus assembly protein TadD